MNVLLVNPYVQNEIRGPHPFKAKDMGVFPHLGLMYIGAVLTENQEFNVTLLDMALEGSCIDELCELMSTFKPSVVGITSYTDCLYDVKVIIDKLKEGQNPPIIIAGGPHVEVYPKEMLDCFSVDYIIRGDGEYSFREVCRRLRDGKTVLDVPGVGYKSTKGIFLNDVQQIESLDMVPFPSRSMSSYNRVNSTVAKGDLITSICSSRGCPFPCTFCNSPYKKYRLRTAKNVVEEIIECKEKYGIREFFFFDDLFNLTKERLMSICDELDRAKCSIQWSFRGRVSSLDKEVLIRCKEVGCNRIHFGVEAGTERILNLYKKGIKLEQVREVFNLCKTVDIETVANFIIGAPTETREEIEETISFALAIDPTFVEFHVLIPYPYTKIYEDMLSKGQLSEDVWKIYSENPSPGFKPPLCNELISEKELYSLLNKAYRRFYYRPTYILKQLSNVKSLREFGKKAWGAYRLMQVTGK